MHSEVLTLSTTSSLSSSAIIKTFLRGSKQLTIDLSKRVYDKHERPVHLVTSSHGSPTIRNRRRDLYEEVGTAIVLCRGYGDAKVL